MAKQQFIQQAIKKPGALRKTTGTKKGKTIPHSTLLKLAGKSGKTGQRARFALLLKKMRQKKKKKAAA